MTGKYKGQTSRIDLRVFIPHSTKDQSPLWVTLMQCSIKPGAKKLTKLASLSIMARWRSRAGSCGVPNEGLPIWCRLVAKLF